MVDAAGELAILRVKASRPGWAAEVYKIRIEPLEMSLRIYPPGGPVEFIIEESDSDAVDI
jgi:hypothetical protein